LPTPEAQFIDKSVERRVEAMRTVVETARVLRKRKNISIRYPLIEMVVIHRELQFLEDIQSLESYILSELNVEKLTVSQDKHKASGKWESEYGSSSCVVMINTAEDKQLVARGLAREVISRIQKLKKQAELVQTSSAVVYCIVKPMDSALAIAMNEHHEQIEQSTSIPMKLGKPADGVVVKCSSSAKIKEAEIELHLVVSEEECLESTGREWA